MQNCETLGGKYCLVYCDRQKVIQGHQLGDCLLVENVVFQCLGRPVCVIIRHIYERLLVKKF